MSEEMIERHQGDEMIRLTLMDGQVRVMMCETTQMAQRAADIHSATPVCTAAMGRLMTATSMLGVMMKGDNESVTVNVHGDGPMGTIVAVANHGDVKVCADDARVELPLRADGKLDVGGAIGHTGRMTVIKDLGLKEPYVGTIELVSGELGIDFAQYFTVSEQQPSLVSLGVLVNGDVVLKAGGLLVQPMPGCEEKTLEQLELRSPMFADISREMTEAPKEQLLEDWFRGMKPGRPRPHAPALSLRMQPARAWKRRLFRWGARSCRPSSTRIPARSSAAISAISSISSRRRNSSSCWKKQRGNKENTA